MLSGGASVSVRGGLGAARAAPGGGGGGGGGDGGVGGGGVGDGPASAVADFDSAMKSLFAKEKGGGQGLGLGLGGDGGAGGAHTPAAHRNLLCATLAAVALVAFFLLPPLWGAGGGAGTVGDDSLRAGRPLFPDRFRLAVIADPDKRSKAKDAAGKDVWRSVYQTVRERAHSRAHAHSSSRAHLLPPPPPPPPPPPAASTHPCAGHAAALGRGVQRRVGRAGRAGDGAQRGGPRLRAVGARPAPRPPANL